MGWGDVFKDLDDDGGERLARIVSAELWPGAMISFGRSGRTWVWNLPEMSAVGFEVTTPATGIILAVDCESDPSTDWFFVLLSTSQHERLCWLPRSLVIKA